MEARLYGGLPNFFLLQVSKPSGSHITHKSKNYCFPVSLKEFQENNFMVSTKIVFFYRPLRDTL